MSEHVRTLCFAYVANDPVNATDPSGMCGTRKDDGSCDVGNLVSSDSANYADAVRAEAVLEERLNALDGAINGLADDASIDLVDSEGNVTGAISGSDLKNKWNNTSFNVTDAPSGNGGVGAIASTFADPSDLSSWQSATANFEVGGVLGYAAHGIAGTNYQILHDIGHVTLPGLQTDRANGFAYFNSTGSYAGFPGSPNYIANERFANRAAVGIGGRIGAPIMPNFAYGN